MNKLFYLFILSIFTVSAGCAAQTKKSDNTQKPNVLFIAVDDLRPELNCFGNAHMHTPNFDRLAGYVYSIRADCTRD